MPASADTLERNLHTIHMNGREVFRFATREVVADAGLRLDDIELVVPHQANLRIIEALGKLLKFPPEKVYVNIEKYANTSSATTIIALDEARRAGRIRQGDLVMLVAFGAGLTWGGVLIRW
jgi:3-oxoacyl-[acyl-carrier-protein] synthase-3